MKKVFSNLLLITSFPFRLIRKLKIDNFVGGLLVGAIFSLIVNVVTLQFEELIQKQRILEAVENEIASNLIRANNILRTNNENIGKKVFINNFYVPPKYSSDLWTQSSEAIQYIAQLDPEVQTLVFTYYSFTVPTSNGFVDKTNEMLKVLFDRCFSIETALMKENELCYELNDTSRQLENIAAEFISKEGFRVLQAFHPTKDRLSNRLLRFSMGDKSVRLLSGE